jgi:hypothetical protein
MDPTRFDRLTKSLSVSGSRRRAFGGLLAGVIGLLGWPEMDEAGAHDARKKCKNKSGQQKKKCLKKAKQHNAQHATETPPCVPESQLTTCGGLCITKINNCGQIVECPCLGLKQCLSNGSCAPACVANEDCPAVCSCSAATAGCGCSIPSVEGPKYCIDGNFDTCEKMPQSCISTAQCPSGQFCITVAGPPGNCGTNRCIPFCTA